MESTRPVEPRCVCKHILRTAGEQATGQCMECKIQAALFSVVTPTIPHKTQRIAETVASAK